MLLSVPAYTKSPHPSENKTERLTGASKFDPQNNHLPFTGSSQSGPAPLCFSFMLTRSSQSHCLLLGHSLWLLTTGLRPSDLKHCNRATACCSDGGGGISLAVIFYILSFSYKKMTTYEQRSLAQFTNFSVHI